MFSQAFVKLQKDEAESLLCEVNPCLDGSVFESDTATVMAVDLTFYPGYRFIEFANYEIDPPNHRFVVYKSDDIVVLDWTNKPIYQLNEKAPLQLDASNVLDYVHFFFTYVRGRHGRFLMVENVDDFSWQEEPPPSVKKGIAQILVPPEIEETEAGYKITACLVFKDSLFRSEINVEKNGQVALSNQELLIEDMPVIDDMIGL